MAGFWLISGKAGISGVIDPALPLAKRRFAQVDRGDFGGGGRARWPETGAMRLSDFDFDLPDRIALHPVEPRDAARLLHVRNGDLDDRIVRDLAQILRPGDVSGPERHQGYPGPARGPAQGCTRIEVTLLTAERGQETVRWWAFARPGKKLRIGDRVDFATDVAAHVSAKPRTARCCWISARVRRFLPKSSLAMVGCRCRPISARAAPARTRAMTRITRRSSPRATAPWRPRRQGSISRRIC